jgi:hypothetical protein
VSEHALIIEQRAFAQSVQAWSAEGPVSLVVLEQAGADSAAPRSRMQTGKARMRVFLITRDHNHKKPKAPAAKPGRP